MEEKKGSNLTVEKRPMTPFIGGFLGRKVEKTLTSKKRSPPRSRGKVHIEQLQEGGD